MGRGLPTGTTVVRRWPAVASRRWPLGCSDESGRSRMLATTARCSRRYRCTGACCCRSRNLRPSERQPKEPLHSPSFYGAMKFLNQFPSKLVSKSQQGVCFMGRFVAPEAHFRRAETLRPECDQPVAVLVEVNQCKGSQQPFVILLQTAIAHLGISEDALQDAEGPFHL